MRMEFNIIIGLAIGFGFIWLGHFVRTKQSFSFLAGFGESWQPVHEERLGKRIGILLIVLGFIVIFTSFFSIWFEDAPGKISGILAIMDVIFIIIVIGLDQIGH